MLLKTKVVNRRQGQLAGGRGIGLKVTKNRAVGAVLLAAQALPQGLSPRRPKLSVFPNSAFCLTRLCVEVKLLADGRPTGLIGRGHLTL